MKLSKQDCEKIAGELFPREYTVSEETLTQFNDAFEMLDMQQQKFIELRYLNGLTYKEITNKMELPYNEVRNKIALRAPRNFENYVVCRKPLKELDDLVGNPPKSALRRLNEEECQKFLTIAYNDVNALGGYTVDGLNDALSLLTDWQRAVVVLRLVDSYSFRDFREYLDQRNHEKINTIYISVLFALKSDEMRKVIVGNKPVEKSTGFSFDDIAKLADSK